MLHLYLYRVSAKLRLSKIGVLFLNPWLTATDMVDKLQYLHSQIGSSRCKAFSKYDAREWHTIK